MLKNPLLAKTLRLLADQGKPGFYEGSVAGAIVAISKQLGGYLTLNDLKQHKSEIVEPVSLRVPGQNGDTLELWEHPPNGQGIVAQMALGLLAEFEKAGRIRAFGEADHNSAE